MSSERPFCICVLGLGNLMRTDDAVGMLVLQQMRSDARVPSEARLIEGGTLGLDLLDSLNGVTHLLAIDAVETGAAPGTLVRFAGESLVSLPVSKSAHLLGFSDLIGVLELLGESPQEVVVLGVQPALIDWGTELTPVVEASRTGLIEAALGQITTWLEKKSDQVQTMAITVAAS